MDKIPPPPQAVPVIGAGGRLTTPWNLWLTAFIKTLQDTGDGLDALGLYGISGYGGVATAGAGPAVDLSEAASAEGTSNLGARASHRHLMLLQAEREGIDFGTVSGFNVLEPYLDLSIEPNLTGSLLTDLLGYWPFTEPEGETRRQALGSMTGVDFLETQGPTFPPTLAGTVPTIAGHYNDLAAYSDPIAYSAFAPYQILQTAAFTPVDLSGGFTLSCWIYLEPFDANTAGTYSRPFEFGYNLSGSPAGSRVQCYRQPDTNLITAQIVGASNTFHATPNHDFGSEEWHLLFIWMKSDGSWASQMDGGEPHWSSSPLNVGSEFPVQIEQGLTFRSHFPLNSSQWTALNGAVQHMTLWGRVLTETERSRVYVNRRANVGVNAAALELFGG